MTIMTMTIMTIMTFVHSLSEDSVISKMETTTADGKSYNTQFYNLDAIISVGYLYDRLSNLLLNSFDNQNI